MRLIVGLGNPERQYDGTRHNLGFMAVAALAETHKAVFRKSPVVLGMAAKATIASHECSLLLPTTFVNNSGSAVKAAVEKQGITLEDMVVVYDDMALPFGQQRLRPEGSAGGHNGVQSIIDHLGSKKFTRLRLGIGRPRPGIDPADYVLSKFTAAENKRLPDLINQALLCVHSWVDKGVEQTMNTFNIKDKA